MPSQETLFNYFTQYNLRIWPMQIIAYVLCVVILLAAFKRSKYSDQIIAAIFASFWLWLGILFWLPFGELLRMAYAMAVLFSVQGVLFLVTIARPLVSYRFGTDVYSLTGLALIVFATIFYELLGYSLGHTFPQSLTLGAFPCPTTIFTLGMFLCTTSKVPKYLLIVPSLTAIFLGSSALYGVLGPSGSVVEDIGLLVSGIVAVVMYIHRDRATMPKSALRPAA